jgi:hypothetical protein
VNNEMHALHKLDRSGHHVLSFGDVSKPEVGLDTERADRGPLWYEAETQTLWFSRRGSEFRLQQFTLTGGLLKEIRLKDGRLSLDDRTRMERLPDGGVLVRPPPSGGSQSLFPLTGGYVVNWSVVSDDGASRYDVFRIGDGRFVTRWTELPWSGVVLVRGSQHGTLLGLSPDRDDVLLVHVHTPGIDDPSREDR